MSLIEYTIDGKVDKVEQAIKRIQLGALSPEPLYVCYSGGKDSKVLRRLMEMSDVQYELHYNMTTVDIPSVVREILNDKDVIVDKARYADGSQKTMWNLIVKKHLPPTRLCRYCCAELKEGGGKGRICVTGVRKAESVRRAKQGAEAKILKGGNALILNLDNDDDRRTIEQCYRTQKTLINPILDWTEEEYGSSQSVRILNKIHYINSVVVQKQDLAVFFVLWRDYQKKNKILKTIQSLPKPM